MSTGLEAITAIRCAPRAWQEPDHVPYRHLLRCPIRLRRCILLPSCTFQCGRTFEEQGRKFDFIVLDADKPMHGEYYNASLRLLRPGGLLVMFGMLLFPTVEVCPRHGGFRLRCSLPTVAEVMLRLFPPDGGGETVLFHNGGGEASMLHPCGGGRGECGGREPRL